MVNESNWTIPSVCHRLSPSTLDVPCCTIPTSWRRFSAFLASFSTITGGDTNNFFSSYFNGFSVSSVLFIPWRPAINCFNTDSFQWLGIVIRVILLLDSVGPSRPLLSSIDWRHSGSVVISAQRRLALLQCVIVLIAYRVSVAISLRTDPPEYQFGISFLSVDIAPASIVVSMFCYLRETARSRRYQTHTILFIVIYLIKWMTSMPLSLLIWKWKMPACLWMMDCHALFHGVDDLLCCDNGGQLVVQVRQGIPMHFNYTDRHAVEMSVEHCSGIVQATQTFLEISSDEGWIDILM